MKLMTSSISLWATVCMLSTEEHGPLFDKVQTENFALTPSLQMIVHPSSKLERDVIMIGGLRDRVVCDKVVFSDFRS